MRTLNGGELQVVKHNEYVSIQARGAQLPKHMNGHVMWHEPRNGWACTYVEVKRICSAEHESFIGNEGWNWPSSPKQLDHLIYCGSPHF